MVFDKFHSLHASIIDWSTGELPPSAPWELEYPPSAPCVLPSSFSAALEEDGEDGADEVCTGVLMLPTMI